MRNVGWQPRLRRLSRLYLQSKAERKKKKKPGLTYMELWLCAVISEHSFGLSPFCVYLFSF